MPGIIADDKGKRLPASYLNFYISNSVVLFPIFGHKNDKIAIEIISNIFKSKKIIGILCNDLVFGLGTLHCISQQQPKLPV